MVCGRERLECRTIDSWAKTRYCAGALCSGGVHGGQVGHRKVEGIVRKKWDGKGQLT